MKLTPLDIRHKEFSRSMRGYKDIEVDEFLDEIADEFERIFKENVDYRDRLESLEEKIDQYKNIEETLKKTLISAQQQAEELKLNSQKESDLILRDAELKARSILNDSYSERQKIQRSVQALKQKQEELRYQLRSTLESYINLIDQEPAELPGDLGEGGEGLEGDFAVAEAAMVEAGAMVASESSAREIAEGSQQLEATQIFDKIYPAGEAAADGSGADGAAADQVKNSKGDDPFGDVEIGPDDNKFKW